MLPEKIYKYVSFCTQSLTNLKDGSLYFSIPSQFNDPFDCDLPIAYDMSFKDVDKLRAIISSDEDMPDVGREQLNEMSDADFYEMIMRLLNTNITSGLKGKGVCCFARYPNNLLMWSHYSQKHTGFCLEFDTKFSPFNEARKVNYVQHFPKLNVEELLVYNFSSVFTLLRTKCLDWGYEEEWRCIHVESPKVYGYQQESLTGVYFGSEMGVSAIEIICLILKGQNSNVKFWRGKKCIDRFGVEFDEFSYVAHLNK